MPTDDSQDQPDTPTHNTHSQELDALFGRFETITLDVNDIDVASLRLEGVAPTRWQYEDVAEPFAGDLCGCTAAGPDGWLDLSLKFNTQELRDAVGPLAGNYVMTLTGALLDGTPIEAQDCAVIFSHHGAASTVQGLQSLQGMSNGLETFSVPSSTVVPRERSVRKPTSRRSRGETK